MSVSEADQKVVAELLETYEHLHREWHAMADRMVGYSTALGSAFYPQDLNEAWKWVLAHRNLLVARPDKSFEA